MATIEQVKVRARIEIGSLKVETPYIQSFSVKKSRGAISTFDASLKISHEDVSGAITGSKVIIYAGVKGKLKKIFTGMVRSAKISPCFDDPQFVMISISGSDNLILLNGKKYTRRCRVTKSKYVTITGVVRAGLKTTGMNYERDPFPEINDCELESTQVAAVRNITMPEVPGVPSGGERGGVDLEVTPFDTGSQT
jgi:hypothetical protein